MTTPLPERQSERLEQVTHMSLEMAQALAAEPWPNAVDAAGDIMDRTRVDRLLVALLLESDEPSEHLGRLGIDQSGAVWLLAELGDRLTEALNEMQTAIEQWHQWDLANDIVTLAREEGRIS